MHIDWFPRNRRIGSDTPSGVSSQARHTRWHTSTHHPDAETSAPNVPRTDTDRTGTHESSEGTMATDYDAPRRTEADEVSEDSLAALTTGRNETQSAVVDIDEPDAAESFDLPGSDLSGEEFTVRVLPKQSDEFTCLSCFLVHHHSRRADPTSDQLLCRDCAA